MDALFNTSVKSITSYDNSANLKRIEFETTSPMSTIVIN